MHQKEEKANPNPDYNGSKKYLYYIISKEKILFTNLAKTIIIKNISTIMKTSCIPCYITFK
jgi:hypothetical protein